MHSRRSSMNEEFREFKNLNEWNRIGSCSSGKKRSSTDLILEQKIPGSQALLLQMLQEARDARSSSRCKDRPLALVDQKICIERWKISTCFIGADYFELVMQPAY